MRETKPSLEQIQQRMRGDKLEPVSIHSCQGICYKEKGSSWRMNWSCFLFLQHKLGALKQEKFIFSQFWRPKVQNQCISRATLPPETQGKNPSLTFPAFCLSSSTLVWQPQHSMPLWSHCSLPFCVFQIFLYLTLIRVQVIAFKANPDNPGYSPHVKIPNLVTSAKFLIQSNLTFTGSSVQDMDIILGATVSLPYKQMTVIQQKE